MQVSTPRRWLSDSPAPTAWASIAAMVWAACPDKVLIAWVATHASAWGSPSAWKHQAAFHKYSRTWMRSMRMWTLTPRRAASARARSSWWRAPSTSTTQVRRWVGSRCSAWSKTAWMTCSLSAVTEPVSHFAWAALVAAALGGGGGDADDIVAAAGGRGGVVGHPQGGHPFACGFLAAGQPGAIRPRPFGLGRLQGRLPQRLGAHHHALAVHRQHQHGGVGARLGHHATGERVDVGRGGHGQQFDPPLAHHLPTAAGYRLGGLVERATHRHPGQPAAAARGCGAAWADAGPHRPGRRLPGPARARHTGPPRPSRRCWPANAGGRPRPRG